MKIQTARETMTLTLDGLRRARARIAQGWTTEELARFADGDACHPCSPDAVAWCAYGAIEAAANGDNHLEARLRSSLSEEMPLVIDESGNESREEIHEWNDRQSSSAPVLAAYDRAIAGWAAAVGSAKERRS